MKEVKAADGVKAAKILEQKQRMKARRRAIDGCFRSSHSTNRTLYAEQL